MAAFGMPQHMLILFQPRPTLPFFKPITKKKPKEYSGLFDFLQYFESEEPPLKIRIESKKERKERKKKEKIAYNELLLKEKRKNYNPFKNKDWTEDPKKTLFIGRLSYDITEKTLRKEFEAYGKLRTVKIIYDQNKKPRGYAFIEYEHTKSLNEAYNLMDGKKIDNRRILVDIERSRVVKNWFPRRLGGGKGPPRGSEEKKKIVYNVNWDALIQKDRYRNDRKRLTDDKYKNVPLYNERNIDASDSRHLLKHGKRHKDSGKSEHRDRHNNSRSRHSKSKRRERHEHSRDRGKERSRERNRNRDRDVRKSIKKEERRSKRRETDLSRKEKRYSEKSDYQEKEEKMKDSHGHRKKMDRDGEKDDRKKNDIYDSYEEEITERNDFYKKMNSDREEDKLSIMYGEKSRKRFRDEEREDLTEEGEREWEHQRKYGYDSKKKLNDNDSNHYSSYKNDNADNDYSNNNNNESYEQYDNYNNFNLYNSGNSCKENQ